MDTADRMKWVDMAKGISIILVVMMYAAYNTGEHTGQIGLLHYAIGFATPFRMPEFFLISGLFLSNVIARPWLQYADRRVVHYFYFYGLWAFLMIALKVGIFSGAPMEMLQEFAIALVQPYGVLWFIYMLAIFSAVAKVLWQMRVPHWAVIVLAAGLQMAPIDSASYAVTQFASYFIFFYLGYAAAPVIFRLVNWCAENTVWTIVGIVVWALVNGALVFSPGYEIAPVGMQMGYAAFPPLHLALALAGACAICASSAILAKLPFMDWLRWIGAHSLVIYVAFTIPMSLFRILAMESGLLTDPSLLGAFVFSVSMISPVILYFITRQLPFIKFLFERPGWASIAGKSETVSGAVSESPVGGLAQPEKQG